jgi:hypothetical protein
LRHALRDATEVVVVMRVAIRLFGRDPFQLGGAGGSAVAKVWIAMLACAGCRGGASGAASDENASMGQRTSVGLMAWTPTGLGVTVPTLFTCGTADALAGCLLHGLPAYSSMPATTPKMIVTISSTHVGQPSAGLGMQGAWGLAFQKLFLDGDERWRAVLLSGNYDDTTIQ